MEGEEDDDEDDEVDEYDEDDEDETLGPSTKRSKTAGNSPASAGANGKKNSGN